MKSIKYLWIALIAIFACGCGGSGSSNNNQFAGAYRSDFTRLIAPDTALLIVVGNNGDTTVVISDDFGVLYSGTGTTTDQGDLNATLALRGLSGTVTVSGTFDGFSDTVDVDLSGGLNDSVTASKFASANESPVAGSFSGSYTGDEDGTFEAFVSFNGNVSGTVHSPFDGNVSLSGHVNEDGTITFTAPGLETGATFDGDIFIVPGQSQLAATGSWDTNSLSGTWDATEDSSG